MIFVMDVGNTHTTAALFKKKELLHFWRITTARHRTQDEWGALLKSLFHFNDLRMRDVGGVIISSVVPPADDPLRQMCLRYFKRDPLFVAPGMKTGIHVHYDPPGDVGADRIVNAVAVCAFYETPAVVVDFGTATTFDVIAEGGDYVGGVITPGIGISSEALFERAAKLPKVELVRPKKVVGRNTVASIQSGLYWGYVSLVEGILLKIKKEFGEAKAVVATGGFAARLSRDCPGIDEVDETLTLKGLRLLYEMNTTRKGTDENGGEGS